VIFPHPTSSSFSYAVLSLFAVRDAPVISASRKSRLFIQMNPNQPNFRRNRTEDFALQQLLVPHDHTYLQRLQHEFPVFHYKLIQPLLRHLCLWLSV
jgi:hypothetical protein